MKKTALSMAIGSLISSSVIAAPYYEIDTSGIVDNYTASDDAYTLSASVEKLSPGGGLAFYSVHENDSNYTHFETRGIGMFNLTSGEVTDLDSLFSALNIDNHTINSIYSPGYREDGTLILSVGYRDNANTDSCSYCTDYYTTYIVNPDLTNFEPLALPEDTQDRDYIGSTLWRWSSNSIIGSKQIVGIEYIPDGSINSRYLNAIFDVDTNTITHTLPSLEDTSSARPIGGYWNALTVEGDTAYGNQTLSYQITSSDGWVNDSYFGRSTDPDATVTEADWKVVRWQASDPENYEVILTRAESELSDFDQVYMNGNTPDGKYIFGEASKYDIVYQACDVSNYCPNNDTTTEFWQTVNYVSSGILVNTETTETREVRLVDAADTASVYLFSALNNDIITGESYDQQSSGPSNGPSSFAYSISNDAFYALNDYLGVDLPIWWVRSINADSTVALAESSCDFTILDGNPCTTVLIGIPQADALITADEIVQPELDSGTGSVGTPSSDSTSSSGGAVSTPTWNGNVISVQGVQMALANTVMSFDSTVSTTSALINGAHSNPLSHLLSAGEKSFWIKGDFGHDDHDYRDGDFSIKELNFGQNMSGVQFNVSLGKVAAKQNLDLGGSVSTDGDFINLESIIPVSFGNKAFVTLGLMRMVGDSDSSRGYENNGNLEYSAGVTDVDVSAVRARLDFVDLVPSEYVVSPYVDVARVSTSIDGFTESGGFFPATFDARSDKHNEIRIGANIKKPLTNGFTLLASGEVARRSTSSGPATVANVSGFDFSLQSPESKRTWGKFSVGVDKYLDKKSNVTFVLNRTTRSNNPSSWVTLNYQTRF